MSFGKRAAQTATDPWLALISVFGGGVAWAVGLSAAAPVAVAAGMYAAGVAIGGLIGRSDKPGEAQLPRLAKGTNQAKMVSVLEHYVTELGRLRGARFPTRSSMRQSKLGSRLKVPSWRRCGSPVLSTAWIRRCRGSGRSRAARRCEPRCSG